MVKDYDVFLIFHERLKYLRDENNLTQEETVNKMKALGYDITVDRLSNIETGRTSATIKDIKAICDFF